MSFAPERFKKYFWDVSLDGLEKQKHARFIIERILEYGDEEAVQWLQQNFSDKDIIPAIKESRRLSPKTRNYWALHYHLWPLEKQSPTTPGATWPH